MRDQPMAFVNLTPTLPRLDLDHRTHSLVYNVLYYPLPPESSLRRFDPGQLQPQRHWPDVSQYRC